MKTSDIQNTIKKLSVIQFETALNPNDPQGDYAAKKQALDDLAADPVASSDPTIAKAIEQRKAELDKEAASKGVTSQDADEGFSIGDEFGISFSEDLEIGTHIVGFAEDGIVVELDDQAIQMLETQGVRFLEGELVEGLKDPKDNPCWKGYHPVGTKKKNGKTVPNCVPEAANPAQQAAIAIAKKKAGKTEDYNPEYDDEAGMADNNLETLRRAVDGLDDLIQTGDNLPEWCQEKIAVAKNMLVAVWDYMESEEATHQETEAMNMPFAGAAVGHKEGPAGQLKGRMKRPASAGDLVGGESIENEAKYHGKEVPLGKKLPGDVKKSKVYVRDPKTGNIKKVNFGDKKMRIKKSNPARRKSFRARHNCANPGPRTKARYWSCRSW